MGAGVAVGVAVRVGNGDADLGEHYRRRALDTTGKRPGRGSCRSRAEDERRYRCGLDREDLREHLLLPTAGY
jgi:hypothetical protein